MADGKCHQKEMKTVPKSELSNFREIRGNFSKLN